MRDANQMLVLSFKEGEELHVGDRIRVTVTRVNGTRVAIAIDAPKDFQVVRSELIERSDMPPEDAGAKAT